MSDETGTTSEVARVLNLHASFKASAEIQDPNTRWYWECDGCDARLALSGTYGRPEVVAALAAHQAAMLAEAGLLRDDRRLLPDPTGGCVCTFESEDRGGGHSELVQEYEPACPVHSEHVYDPIQGMWVFRGEVPKNPTKPVDPWAERLDCPRCCPEPT